MVKTTIQISDITLTKLKLCKEYKRDTYDEIINRLIDGTQTIGIVKNVIEKYINEVD